MTDNVTLIETPRGKIPIGDFTGGKVYSYDYANRRIIIAHAEPAKRYTEQDLYEVKMLGGDSIVVSDENKFLTRDGWMMAKELSRNDSLVVGEEVGGIAAYAKVEYVRFKKKDFYWEVNVIGTHNYIAHGFVIGNSIRKLP